jgi:nitrogen fixation protein NifQ
LRDALGMARLAAREAATTGEGLSARLGLPTADLAAFLALIGASPESLGVGDVARGPSHRPDEEEVSVLELLAAELASTSPLGRFLPAILARRAMEPNHLWEDLGLMSRPDLTQLMARHFPGLAARNPGMRWKRFLYRSLCERQGFVACAAPSCAQCDEFSICFDGEDGESRLAQMRRAADLAAD